MSVYLDNAATTRVCPEAASAALAVMTEGYHNPSSRYTAGQAAAQRLLADRTEVAAALGCKAEEITFTSCGTEGDNWSIRAAAAYGKRRGNHIVTSVIEHSAVLEPIRALAQEEGYEVTYLKPDHTGHISPADLEAALRPDTILVSLMLVNNELGTLQPVAEAAEAIRRTGSPALLHTDAVQGFLKIPFSPAALGADLVTISGHKVQAPKGIGAQYIRPGLKLSPLLVGGGQENGLRPGTEPTAQIAALAAACRVWRENGADFIAHMRDVKQYAIDVLTTALPILTLISDGDAPHILALSLPGYPSEMLVRALDDRGICVSSGSACHRGKPSHVFSALGLSKPEATGALRISFSPSTTRLEIDALRDSLLAVTQARVPMRP